jgi:ABC-2 type transport system ATP-binding protein
MTMAAEAIAEFHDVTKTYPWGLLKRKAVTAVAGVSLRVERGEVFGLLGPNRAGKTTLIKMLLSLCRPTSGQVSRLGRPAADRSTLARIGYVHENQAFPRYLTATDLLVLYGALTLLPEPEVRARAAELLELVGLEDRAQEPIARFSKGMIQRLGLAQALLNDPELLVMDEPSEGLDLTGRQLTRTILSEQRQAGRSVILVTHLLADVESACDRVGVVVGGRVAYVGTPDALKGGGTLEEALKELYSQQPKQQKQSVCLLHG